MVAGTSYVIYRKTRTAANKFSLNRLVIKLKTGEVSPSIIATDLDIPYTIIPNITRDAYSVIVNKIRSATSLGDYNIHYSAPINDREFLILTELSFTDFNITVTGSADDVHTKVYHNFLLKHDLEKSQITIWSSLYENVTAKFQKEEFMKAL